MRTPSPSLREAARRPDAVAPGLVACAAVAVVLAAAEAAVPALPAPLAAVAAGALVGRAGAVRRGAALASGTLLRAGIVLLGLRLSAAALADAGPRAVLLAATAVVFGGLSAFALARRLGAGGRLATLLAVGTAVCGNSAIAACAPVIGARDEEVAGAVGAVTLYGTAALFAFPALGWAFGLDARTFGLWAGGAINDTSQVVAAAFAHSAVAGSVATVVKLTRNLMIIPAVALAPRIAGVAPTGGRARVPSFVVGFAAAALLASTVALPAPLVAASGLASKLLILAALVGIGAGAGSLRFGRGIGVPLAAGAGAGIVLAGASLAVVLSTP